MTGTVAEMILQRLGSIDTGPLRHWRHLILRGRWPIVLCGNNCSNLSLAKPTSTSQKCPDCARIAKERGYPW